MGYIPRPPGGFMSSSHSSTVRSVSWASLSGINSHECIPELNNNLYIRWSVSRHRTFTGIVSRNHRWTWKGFESPNFRYNMILFRPRLCLALAVGQDLSGFPSWDFLGGFPIYIPERRSRRRVLRRREMSPWGHGHWASLLHWGGSLDFSVVEYGGEGWNRMEWNHASGP